MAAAHSFLKAQTFEQMTQVVKPYGGIGSPAENPPENLVRSDNNILLAAPSNAHHLRHSSDAVTRLCPIEKR